MRTMGVRSGVSKGNRFSPYAVSLEEIIDFEKLNLFHKTILKDIEKCSFHYICFVSYLQLQEQKKIAAVVYKRNLDA